MLKEINKDGGESLLLLDQKEQNGRTFTEVKDYYCRKESLDHALNLQLSRKKTIDFNNLDSLQLSNLLDLIRSYRVNRLSDRSHQCQSLASLSRVEKL